MVSPRPLSVMERLYYIIVSPRPLSVMERLYHG